ncbi:class I SAM-dependent methyltransferase [Streptomyces sp. NBC_00209]|uniref:class I SAM-dependent methyltransferase n=1 Tax=Streptomyces sp. NBC_00209 TaxID=2975682 RepID=UPI003243D9FF
MTATRATALFDQLASVYDEVLPFFAGFARQHVEWLAPGPGTRVLDLGAGRGALTGAALARGCRVTAVDCAPGMVERLAAQYPQVREARVMDVHRLDFPDGSFDLPADAHTEFEARVRAELSAMEPIVCAAGARLWEGTTPA